MCFPVRVYVQANQKGQIYANAFVPVNTTVVSMYKTNGRKRKMSPPRPGRQYEHCTYGTHAITHSHAFSLEVVGFEHLKLLKINIQAKSEYAALFCLFAAWRTKCIDCASLVSYIQRWRNWKKSFSIIFRNPKLSYVCVCFPVNLKWVSICTAEQKNFSRLAQLSQFVTVTSFSPKTCCSV